jgi:mono/diheme cytochrome c family protein
MKVINIRKSLGQTAIALVASLSLCLSGQSQNAGVGAPSYDQLVVKANSLLKESKLDEARQTAEQAIQQDTNRYEAYVVAAKIASLQSNATEASQFAQKALQLAPGERKAQVQQLATTLAAATSPSQTDPSKSISIQDRRILDILMLILEDAEKAATPEDSAKAYQEYLQKSADFVVAHPEQTDIWVMRAFAAVELDEPQLGWEAGKKLRALGADTSDDAKLRRIMAMLDRKGWLGENPPTARSSQASSALKPVAPLNVEPVASASSGQGLYEGSQRLYEAKCLKCHGREGKGDTTMGQRLQCKDFSDPSVQAIFSDAQSFKAIKEGLKRETYTLMLPANDLTDSEIKGLIAYVRTLKQ